MNAKMENANSTLRLDPHRVLTVEEKLNISQALYETAKVVKIAMLRRSHPDWSETQLLKEAQRMLFLMHD
jgi:hypothetical protein